MARATPPATITGVADSKRPWWQIGNTPTAGFVMGGISTVMAVLRWGNVVERDSDRLGGMPAQVILAIVSTLAGAFFLFSAVRLRRAQPGGRGAK